MKPAPLKILAVAATVILLSNVPGKCWALASNNIPLDSPVYLYLEKLAGFGLLDTDIKGLRPFSRAEAARLLLEAEGKLKRPDGESSPFVSEVMLRLRELLPREVALRNE